MLAGTRHGGGTGFANGADPGRHWETGTASLLPLKPRGLPHVGH